MSGFQKAERRKAKLRLGLIGPSGSGKSATALRIASGLGGKIAAIDSENESLSLYAPTPADPGFCPQGFDTLNLHSFSPANYVKAIQDAGRAGYDVIIIDSMTHAWNGTDGALEQVDRAMARSSGNKFAAWRDVTPMHNALVNAIIQSPCHVIATIRTKTEYVVEKDERGKSVPRKIGLAPIQRDGMEYEFTIVADMDLDHNMIVTKTRCPAMDGKVIKYPGPEVSATLLQWLNAGTDVPNLQVATETVTLANPEQVGELAALIAVTKTPESTVSSWLAKAKVNSLADMPQSVVEKCINFLKKAS